MTSYAGWGFGSPSSLPGASADYFDWGFGAPTPTSWAGTPVDSGFGDPSYTSVEAFVLPIAPDHVFPDDGGELVEIRGNWSAALPGALGPYRVRLRDANTNTVYPETTEQLGCYSGLPGKNIACETDVAQQVLRFALPPAPPGVYDVVIYYGPGLGFTLELADALRIIRRGRSPGAWRIRANLPVLWSGAGARSSSAEELQGAE